jgi:hypothetical protein
MIKKFLVIIIMGYQVTPDKISHRIFSRLGRTSNGKCMTQIKNVSTKFEALRLFFSFTKPVSRVELPGM